VEQPEGLSQLLVRLEGSGLEAWDEFLLRVVGEREAIVAVWEAALLNHQILMSDAKLNATGRDFCQIWCD
jgi:hypothetical protein